jgi:16S rRNA (guanine(966)-N(2))-methyltransferase RsmD
LNSPRGEDVRPTTDRVKEAMFNILGPSVEDSLVLDLCCGSGGLGIEALSRGARRVRFVDADTRSLETARANLEACGAEPDTYRLIRSDAQRWLEEWGPPTGGAPWILLADPPYRTALAQAIMNRVDDFAEGEGFVAAIVEFGSRDAEELTFQGTSWEVRTYGETGLAVRRAGRPSETKE